MTTPLVLTSPEELRDFLANPHAHEELDEPILVLELAEPTSSHIPEPESKLDGVPKNQASIADSLLALPAVTVLLTEEAEKFTDELAPAKKTGSPANTAFLRHFDIITDNATGDLDDITETVIASPQASVSLVQLLRAGETMNVRDALMAESWVYSMLQSGAVFQNWLRTKQPKKQETAQVGHPQSQIGQLREDKKIPAYQEMPTSQSDKEEATSANQPAVLTDDNPTVLIDHSGDTLHLTLNRPNRRNAFSAEMRDRLVEALRAANPTPPTGGILLTGTGEAFCSGGDLNEFGTTPDPATAHIVRSLRSAAWEMHLLRDHISVNLHGACVGAGIELPAFTNNITSTPDAFFWLPEVRYGLIPGAGGTASLPRRIGRHRTTWLALTNRRLNPPTAKKWGLIDAITP